MSKANSKLKYTFDYNIPLSLELCEFIGAIIGDGFVNYCSRTGQTQITGDKKLDSHYYHNYLKLFSKKLFNIDPKIYEKDNTIRLNIYSKKLLEFLSVRFNIPLGKKCYTIEIPKEILLSEKEFINRTLRGMFDTDGGVGFDRRKTYKKPYIRINYCSASKKLIKQISKVLFACQIKHSIHKKRISQMIQINGEKNVKKFMSIIGFSNKRHLDKVEAHFAAIYPFSNF